MKPVVLAALLTLGGCGKKADEARPAPTPVAATSECGAAVNTAIDTIVAKKKAAGGELTPQRAERFEKLRGAMATRCSEDTWPAPMLACVTAMQSQPDLVRCMSNLDAASMQKLQADISATMLGGMRGPGGPEGSGAQLRTHSFDIVQAFEKRVTELDTRIATATTAIADAKTDADRATAKAELERLTREKTEVAAQLATIKASHGGDLAPTIPGSVPAPGSGSSAK